MTENTTKRKSEKPADAQWKSPIQDAPRQPATNETWSRFSDDLVGALYALEEGEHLVINVKGTGRYVQFMDQGRFGMRVESVSDYYLPEDEHLSEQDYGLLVKFGWLAPTRLPDEFGRDSDGSPNYFVDLAQPVSLQDVAMLAVLTLINVHAAGHPGNLEYDARTDEGGFIRFPHLRIRRRREKALGS